MSSQVPYAHFEDVTTAAAPPPAAAAAYDDDEFLEEEEELQEEGTRALAVANQRKEFMELMKSPKLSQREIYLIMRIREENQRTPQMPPLMTPQMMALLVGRSGLAHKIMVALGINDSALQGMSHLRGSSALPVTKKIVNKIERQVNGRKLQDMIDNALTLYDLRDYSRERHMRGYQAEQDGLPVVPPLQLSEVSCLPGTKKNLKKLLEEKNVEIYKLERIYSASTSQSNVQMANEFDGGADFGQGGSRSRLRDTLRDAEQYSRQDLIVLNEQRQEIRTRIEQLNGRCTILGGKTKSKYTKSKYTKSKHTKSKHTKSKHTKSKK